MARNSFLNNHHRANRGRVYVVGYGAIMSDRKTVILVGALFALYIFAGMLETIL